MACSRDEQHGRAPAHPPKHFGKPDAVDQLGYLMPIDPSSKGTWVAVNAMGLAFTLLNYNLPTPPTGRDRSRGDVIPALLQAQTIDHAVELAKTIERERMMPFRLVICDGDSLLLWHSTEPIEQAEVMAWDRQPVMFTSSGLGDHLVEGPRRELFEDWFSAEPMEYAAQQTGFHCHQWPGREQLSVCMHREDARTVSYTVVDVHRSKVTMTYHPDRPDRDAEPVIASLKRS
ncbi:MAG: NRDE family protein [Phycisphaeraceae bacterium]